MTKTKFWLSILAISVVLIAGSLAASPIAIASDEPDEDDDEPEEVIVANTEPIPVTGSISSSPICPAENVQHWETITWSGPPIQHPTLPNVDSNRGTVKAQIDPNAAIDYQLVLISRLNELGYTINGNPLPIETLNAQQHESQIICAEN